MKKEDLVALGLSEEQIAEIQKLNGKDIAKEQEKIARIEAEKGNYKSQLDTAHEALKKFEGIDVDKLQGEIQKLQKDLQDAETKHQADLADRDFNVLLDSQINALGAKNAKAVKALLDIDALKGSKNQIEDIKKALEAVKTENDYLFGSTEPINNPVRPTGNNPPTGDFNMATMRAVMGLPPENK
jgi:DNA-binding transcriptional regulator GbsR (MarR family)